MGWRNQAHLLAVASLLALLGWHASDVSAQSDPPPPALILPFPEGQAWRITCGYAPSEGEEAAAEGRVCGHSGSQWNRYALDLQHARGRKAAEGQPVRATAAGNVSEAGWEDGLGWHVFIDHGDGYTTVYAHLHDPPVVAEGAQVRQGETIGYTGCTGRCTGDHIHFVLWKDGVSVPFEPVCGQSGFVVGQVLLGCGAPAPPDDGDPTDLEPLAPLAFFHTGDGGARIDSFTSDRTSFAGPTVAWRAPEGAPALDARFVLQGDFTGDGQSDVTVLAAGAQCELRALVYAAGGDGFTDPDPAGWWSDAFDCARPVRLAAAADFDGDGVSDLALLRDGTLGGSSIELLRSDGASFASTALLLQSAAGEAAGRGLVAGDFDGDGRADLALLLTAPDGCRAEVAVLISGEAGFDSGESSAWWAEDGVCEPPIGRIASVDFDGDGRADVALLRQGIALRRMEVLRSDGARFIEGEAPWWAEEAVYPPDNIRSIAAGDFDADGRTDLALLSDDGSCAARLRVLLAHDGAFSTAQWWAAEDYCAQQVAPGG